MVLRGRVGEGHPGRESDLRRASLGGLSTNEENVRRGVAAFSSGNTEEFFAAVSPEIEWHVTFQLPDLPPGMKVARGHDEVRELLAAFRSGFEEVTLEPEEVIADEDDVIVCKVRFRGRGSSSGIEVDRTLYYVFEVRDDLLHRIRPFDDPDQALRAAGIAEMDH